MTPDTLIAIPLHDLFALIAALIVGIATVGKVFSVNLIKTLDKRFEQIDKRFTTLDGLHTEISRVDKDVLQVRLEMATNFVRQEGLGRLATRMEELFNEAFTKLENKADKEECHAYHRGAK